MLISRVTRVYCYIMNYKCYITNDSINGFNLKVIQAINLECPQELHCRAEIITVCF